MRHLTRAVLVILAIGLLAGTATPAEAAARDAGALCGVRPEPPHTWRHVIWIWMENHGFDDVIGSADAPFLNSLAATCGLATDYHAITHPSLPDYLGATSGEPLAAGSDCGPLVCPQDAVSLFEQLSRQGRQWRAYSEGMTANCQPRDGGGYVAHHNPAVYYTRIAGDCARWNVPMGTIQAGAFLTDLTNDTLPAFSFVTPGHCHDMDVCGVATGDAFLAAWLDVIGRSAAYRKGHTAVFITFDEGSDPDRTDDCLDASTPDCRVATFVVAPSTPRGARSARRFDHYGLLRTTEQMLGLHRFLGHAADQRTASLRGAFEL